jgi:hypothetical protein
MGRPQPEDSIVDKPDISDNNIELAMPVDLSSVAGKDYADEVPPGIDPSPDVDLSLALGKDHTADEVAPSIDPSPKVDLSLASGEVQTACSNQECQSKVLTLDGEAALPPSKRLHRALEAMSANAAETVSNPPDVNNPKEFILKHSTTSIASSPSNNSADALVDSPKTAPNKSPEICANEYSLDTPTGQKYISLPVIIKKDSPPTCSLESKEPAVVFKHDQFPLEKASRNELPDPFANSGQDFSKIVDGSACPLSPAKTVVSAANDDCNSLPDTTVLAEPTVSVTDRTSVSPLVTKVTCGQSVAGTWTFEG